MSTLLDPLPECPVARTVQFVGETWSLLILRNAYLGATRFDAFQRGLGVAPNMLTRRLKHLTDCGLFERRLYQLRPARYEYILTEKARDFFPVVVAMVGWCNRNMAPEGSSLVFADRITSQPVEAVLIDAVSRSPITFEAVYPAAGPCASADMQQRLAAVKAQLDRPARALN